jgi:hypothetical protein
MSEIGVRVEETGMLLREHDSYVLRRDLGGRWKLDLHRVSISGNETRVTISGVVVAQDLIDVIALRPAD